MDKCTKIKNKNDIHRYTVFTDIPIHFQKDLRNHKFLQFDKSYGYQNRFTIFFSDENLKFIKNVNTVLIDGTFWSVPKNYAQLLTINCFIFGKFFPLIYILMSDKSQENYTEAFNELVNLTSCRFKIIIIDFEMALKNSLKTIFVNSKLFGCSFHFGQSIWRNIQRFNLVNEYQNNFDFRKQIRKFINLSFIPTEFIISTFYSLRKEAETKYPIILNDFLLYFQNIYIGTIDKNPLFEIEFWSCHFRVINNICRTTNSLEAWHRSLNFKCNIQHLNLGKFLEILIQENEKVRVNIIQFKNLVYVNKTILEKKEQLRIITGNYEFYEQNEYFDYIDKLINWKFE